MHAIYTRHIRNANASKYGIESKNESMSECTMHNPTEIRGCLTPTRTVKTRFLNDFFFIFLLFFLTSYTATRLYSTAHERPTLDLVPPLTAGASFLFFEAAGRQARLGLLFSFFFPYFSDTMLFTRYSLLLVLKYFE